MKARDGRGWANPHGRRLISRGLVEQMGGEMGLESEVGAGTTFIIRLPLAADPPAELIAGDQRQE